MSRTSQELEVKVAFLEDSLNKLSDEFFTQHKELQLIKNQLAMLLDKMRNGQENDHSGFEINDEKPPHY